MVNESTYSKSQVCAAEIRKVLATCGLERLWTADGPTAEAVRRLREAKSSEKSSEVEDPRGETTQRGESIMLRVAFDLWNGGGKATVNDLVLYLNDTQLCATLEAMEEDRPQSADPKVTPLLIAEVSELLARHKYPMPAPDPNRDQAPDALLRYWQDARRSQRLLGTCGLEELWTGDGPTEEAVRRLLECAGPDELGDPIVVDLDRLDAAERAARAEALLLRASFDLWNGGGAATVGELVTFLQDEQLRAVRAAIEGARPGASPRAEASKDPRFTPVLIADLSELLARHGYPMPPPDANVGRLPHAMLHFLEEWRGPDAAELGVGQRALLHFLQEWSAAARVPTPKTQDLQRTEARAALDERRRGRGLER